MSRANKLFILGLRTARHIAAAPVAAWADVMGSLNRLNKHDAFIMETSLANEAYYTIHYDCLFE